MSVADNQSSCCPISPEPVIRIRPTIGQDCSESDSHPVVSDKTDSVSNARLGLIFVELQSGMISYVYSLFYIHQVLSGFQILYSII